MPLLIQLLNFSAENTSKIMNINWKKVKSEKNNSWGTSPCLFMATVQCWPNHSLSRLGFTHLLRSEDFLFLKFHKLLPILQTCRLPMTHGIFKDLFFKNLFIILFKKCSRSPKHHTFKRQAQTPPLFVLPPQLQRNVWQQEMKFVSVTMWLQPHMDASRPVL